MKFQPRKPPRYQQDYSVYFLTYCTFNRSSILHTPGIPEFLIEELYFYEQKVQKLVAYTIMPEHMHVMVEVGEANSLSKFLHSFKSFTSKEIRKRIIGKNESSRRLPAVVPGRQSSPTGRRLLQPSAPSGGRLLRPDRVWQPGTMDHCIRVGWGNTDYENHLSYLFYNSQKHLGIAPKDFPYHNFSEFVNEGTFDENFCMMNEKSVKEYELYE